MSIVVVGKGGTLGSRLAERLAADAIEVRSPDARDFSPIAEVAAADVVVNASGPRVRPGLGWTDYFREHVGVTTRIVGSMAPGTHLVHLSSTAVFGARAARVDADSPPAPTLFPSPAYACAKLAAELAARTACRQRGVALTVLRPSMVYGPGVDSALESIRRLALRGVRLRLLPMRLRQHLVHVELFEAVVRRATEAAPSPERERVLLVADPFVLRNEDVVPRGTGMVVPVPVDRAGRIGVGRIGEAFRVLAMDNEFDVHRTFTELGIDAARFARAHTFDPYWSLDS